MKSHVKVLAATLAVSVALVGAGYAAWGTEITSTTKMQTGEWKIVLENDSGASYWAGDQIGTFARNGGVLNGSIDDTQTTWGALETSYDAQPAGVEGSVSGADYVYVMRPEPQIAGSIPGAAAQGATSCTFQFYNLHPGTRAFTRFEVRNDGSIGAKIGDVRVVILDKAGNAIDLTSVSNLAVKQVIDAMKVNPVFGLHTGTGADTPIAIAPTTLGGLESALDAALVGKVLLPDFTLYSYSANSRGSDELDTGSDNILANSFNFELPASALEGNTGMNANFQVVMYIDFVQYNQNVANPT